MKAKRSLDFRPDTLDGNVRTVGAKQKDHKTLHVLLYDTYIEGCIPFVRENG